MNSHLKENLTRYRGRPAAPVYLRTGPTFQTKRSPLWALFGLLVACFGLASAAFAVVYIVLSFNIQ